MRRPLGSRFATAYFGVVGCLASFASVPAQAGDITVWHNYGTEVNATALTTLVSAFEAKNPNIRVKVISQPADNYFALLTVAAISHRAPDIAVMWTGTFALKYAHLLADLKPLLAGSDLTQMKGRKWASEGFDTSRALYLVPFDDQFYLGFYNRALLKKAGIDAAPTDWSELAADCTKLRTAGITPMLYGSDSQALSSEFSPVYDLSYLAAGIFSVDQFPDFANGKIAWTDPRLIRQVQNWADLHATKCTNANVLTASNVLGKFEDGQAAIIVGGSWNLQQVYSKLGSDLGVFPLPYSDTPIKAVVEMPGAGLSILKSSSNRKDAAAFLTFVMSGSGQDILSKEGLIPAREGYSPTNPLLAGLLQLPSRGFGTYPMIDNVIQPSVTDTSSRVLDAAFAQQMTVPVALQKMQDSWAALPPAERR